MALIVETIRYESRDAWLDLRRADLTASEAGALFGVHKYKTPRKLAAEKAYGENRTQNAAMRRGKIMEPAVAEALVVDHGWTVHRVDNYLRARDPDDPYVRMGATRDYTLQVTVPQLLASPLRDQALALGWDFSDVLNLAVECKSVDPYVYEHEWGEHVPKYHVVQAAQQAMLANADGAIIACLVENRARDLYLYAVPRRDDFEAELVARVREFWRRYAEGEEYPAEPADNGEMATYFPDAVTDMVVDLTRCPACAETDVRCDACRATELGWQETARALAKHKGEVKRLEGEIDGLEAKFKDRMREAERAILPGWEITWRGDHGKRRFLFGPAKQKRGTRR